jgi:SAM-dependent methyltransferase
MHDDLKPSAWMIRNAVFVGSGYNMLDVACGRGRHARYFAARGIKVTAVDRDAAALQSMAGIYNITTERRDLELEPWPYAPHSFDVVLVCNYLFRPAAKALLETVKPGGILLYETFASGNARYGKPSRPEFLLNPNELMMWTKDDFRAFAFDQSEERDGDGKPVAVKQRIAAVKLVKTEEPASPAASSDSTEEMPVTPQ